MAESQSHASEVSWLRGLALSARLLARDWRAGEMRVLADRPAPTASGLTVIGATLGAVALIGLFA